MEKMLLNLGLSFTAAKVLPYLFFTAIGVVMAYMVFKRNLKPALKWPLVVLLAAVPFLLYFAINPIYQGDFSNQPKEIKLRNSYTTRIMDGLLVMAIPGCPYCLEATEVLKQMKDQNPKLNIHFMVIGDTLNLAPYRDLSEGKFQVVSLENPPLFTANVGSSFPTFIKVQNGTALKYWTNNEFGVGAKDELISSF